VPCIRRVNGSALGVLAARLVGDVDLRQVQPPPEHGLDVAVLVRLGAGAVHERLHPRVAGEVQVDVLLGSAAFDLELLRQAECRHAVDEAEVDCLGRAAQVVSHGLRRHPEHLGGGGAVHVGAGGERLAQALVLRQVRHDAQLDLRVVGGEQRPARLRHECLADAPASSVRTGMFCRLGSLDDSRPVAATAWW